MLLVGLTGGIGSGKSTVARLLAERGAVVFEADDFARRALDPGTPGHDQVVADFGPQILRPSGEIDRHGLAERVFSDPDARRRLEAIVHPEVARLLAEALEPYRETDRVVVYVVPLLVENRMQVMFDVVVVVSAAETARVARLVAERAMSEHEIRERMAAQVPDEERLRAAHFVLSNNGSVDDLEREVDVLWDQLEQRVRAS
jgi:dephospho-CoA kinase